MEDELSILNKWKNIKLLDHICEKDQKTIALCLENQRLYNEQITHELNVPTWKRNSIPIVLRVFAQLLKDGISITSSVDGKHGQYNIIDPNLIFEPYVESNRKIWERCHIKLDYECEYVQDFKDRVINSIKNYMHEGNYNSYNFKGIGWFSNGTTSGTLAFYGDFIKGNKMNLSQAVIPFDTLNKILGLPSDTSVVSVKENEQGNNLVIKIISPREPLSRTFSDSDPISRLGEGYQEGAIADSDNSKGFTRSQA